MLKQTGIRLRYLLAAVILNIIVTSMLVHEYDQYDLTSTDEPRRIARGRRDYVPSHHRSWREKGIRKRQYRAPAPHTKDTGRDIRQHLTTGKFVPGKTETSKFVPGKTETNNTCSISHEKQITRNLTEVKVLCLVFTMPESWNSKAKSVRDTWARRCDKAVFIYSRVPGVTLPSPALAIDAPEGRGHLTTKTMLAFDIAYKTYGSQFDWFMKADDDTYVIMENLKYLLSHYNASVPHYLGRVWPNFIATGYNSGGAGYVLSRPAVKIMYADGQKGGLKKCSRKGAVEDLDVGVCLSKYGVYPDTTTDGQCRLMFNSDDALLIFQRHENEANALRQANNGNGVSDNPKVEKVPSPYTATFHHVKPEHMYMYDFLLYDLRRQGGAPR